MFIYSCSLTSEEVRELYWRGGAEANESTDIVFLSTKARDRIHHLHTYWISLCILLEMCSFFIVFCLFLVQQCRSCCSWTAPGLCGQSCVRRPRELSCSISSSCLTHQSDQSRRAQTHSSTKKKNDVHDFHS